ncbi:MAG: hypothetical protein PHW37_02470 [Acholeplasmataceae bacterium]|nr:hypothetical protein [Acholeplasmataceae bacterium]MDD4194114.1 hypothetical protein [Acholeplasmataceae bacterium]
MKEFVKAIDGLPWIVKLILALPGIDGFAWGIYRLVKGISSNNMTLIIAGIVWILVGWAVLWILDIFTLVTQKNVTIFA